MTVDLVSLAIIALVAAACPIVAKLIPNKLVPETVFLLIDAFVERFLKLGKFPLLFGEVFFDAQEFVFFFGRFFKLFLKPLALLLKLAVAGLQLALAFLELVLKFALLVEQLVLALKKDFLLLRLSFLAGFFDYAGRQLGGVANPLGIEVFIEIKPTPR